VKSAKRSPPLKTTRWLGDLETSCVLDSDRSQPALTLFSIGS
jgi:hypothetical protein